LSGLTSQGTDLQTALASVASGLGANNIGLVSLAAGTSGGSYAGNYMIIGNGVAGYQNNLDGVVKLNTLAGITAATFFV
jgi:hypothetical protein